MLGTLKSKGRGEEQQNATEELKRGAYATEYEQQIQGHKLKVLRTLELINKGRRYIIMDDAERGRDRKTGN